ncbi:hypothetical protein B0O79_2135 [Flavobacteriaceae bacterium MAR_2009_75]|nr:hypothetical protein B0O79_2135 [Flavobacteriaceae bacterium MAR_2009_75]
MFCILVVVLALAVITDNKEEFSVDELAIIEGEEENIVYGESKNDNLKNYSPD